MPACTSLHFIATAKAGSVLRHIRVTSKQELKDRSFAYFFVVLFLLLVAASLWVAWTNWREDPTQRTGVHVTTWVCRVLIGCMWFQGCLWKLPLPISDGFQYWTGQMAEHAAFGFHRALVTDVYLPYLYVMQSIVFLAEISFATSLILGLDALGTPFNDTSFRGAVRWRRTR